MSRYIDYDAIDYRNDKLHDKSEEFLNGVIYMAQRIEEAPSIDIEPKRGKWEEKETFRNGDDEPIIEEWQSAMCSVCHKYHTTPYIYSFNDYNFCPNCGADMRE